MSLNDIFESETVKENAIDVSLADALKKLISYLDSITEYSKKDLLPISMIQSDKYLWSLFKHNIPNRKHINRRFEKTILDAIQKIGQSVQDSKFTKLLLKMRGIER